MKVDAKPVKTTKIEPKPTPSEPTRRVTRSTAAKTTSVANVKSKVMFCTSRDFNFGMIYTFLECSLFYPWVMYVLTIRITEAYGLSKPSDVAPLLS